VLNHNSFLDYNSFLYIYWILFFAQYSIKETPLKKILAAVFLLFIFSSVSYASVFMDLGGSYVMAGDAKNQYGATGTLGFSIHKDASFIAKSTYSTVTENQGDPDEVKYTHFTNLFGFEYTPYIPVLERYRLSWKSMALFGISQTEIDDSSTGDSSSEMGPAFAILTGIKFDATQTLAPFINIGYHYSMYRKDLKDLSIQGFQAEIGIRFYFTGNKSYSDRY